MFSLLAVSSAAASALGTYNIARFVATKAIEKRRKVKEYRSLVEKINKVVVAGEKVYNAVSDGVDPAEAAKIKAIADAVKTALDGQPVPKSKAE